MYSAWKSNLGVDLDKMGIKWAACLPILALVECFGLMAPGAPPLRGGHRQKRRLLEPQEPVRGVFESSPLGTGLLIRWAEGQLTAGDVMELELLAAQSGCSRPEVQWLSSIGGADSHQNCSRALYRKYLAENHLPEPFIIKLPLLEHKDRTKTVEVDVAIYLPHDWLYYLAKHYPSDFESMFGSMHKIKMWWQRQCRRNPKFAGHPMLKHRSWSTTCCPLVLHGDGVQFQQRDNLMTISIKSLLFCRDSCKDAHLLLVALPKSICTAAVWPIVWDVLGWSFEALLAGKHPSRDPFGQSWPAGSFRSELAGAYLHPSKLQAVIWGIVGDLDFFNKDLGMPAMNARMFCWRCLCDRDAVPWNDFRPSAAWRNAILAPEVVRDTPRTCNLFKYAGISCLMLMFDLMHTGDQGLILHLVANVLFTIAVFDLPGDPSANFDGLWQRISVIYTELGLEHVLTKLQLSQVCDPKALHTSFPHLGKVKAAEARHLLQCVAQLAAEYEGPSDSHKHRTRCAKSLAKFYNILEQNGQVVENYEELQSVAQQILLHYHFLSKEAMDSGHLLYSLVNKFHFFEHLVGQAEFENPMMYWAYSGEDFVGRVARIGHLCLPGKPTHQITPILLHRYAIGLHLRLTRLA